MLTVNYRDEDGVETLTGALSVRFVPDTPGNFNAIGDDVAGVHVTGMDGEAMCYVMQRHGSSDKERPQVFVMNEAGKTVARYSL